MKHRIKSPDGSISIYKSQTNDQEKIEMEFTFFIGLELNI